MRLPLPRGGAGTREARATARHAYVAAVAPATATPFAKAVGTKALLQGAAP